MSDKRAPSPEYIERLRQEIREDKDGYYAREIAEFRDFLESRGAGRELDGDAAEGEHTS